jgi:carbamoyl-phosphate synthase large subunit
MEGVEYTVSVIVNDTNTILGIVPKRVIEKRGITRAAVAERNLAIERACRKVVSALEPRGLFNVQLKLVEGKVYIFEINPRLSTTVVLTDKAFGNEVELYLDHQGKTHVKGLPRMKKGVSLYRYEENVFVRGKKRI